MFEGQTPRTFLITGVAGFIGAHIADTLLAQGQTVVGVDNLSTGLRSNLDGAMSHAAFSFHEGDITDRELLARVMQGVDVVLHQAALGSVPRSMKTPFATHEANDIGFVSVLDAARVAGVGRFVFASSSSVYGDDPNLPKIETQMGTPLSPYAATKKVNEVYARSWQKAYGIETVGLRYFNVFGPRQRPDGAYAAVIPRWLGELTCGKTCHIFGDGETSRDFCYIDNAVQANLRAAVCPSSSTGRAYNVACGERTTLNDLYAHIRDALAMSMPKLAGKEAEHSDFRPGDVRHSLANIEAAREGLGYEPTVLVADGLQKTVAYFLEEG